MSVVTAEIRTDSVQSIKSIFSLISSDSDFVASLHSSDIFILSKKEDIQKHPLTTEVLAIDYQTVATWSPADIQSCLEKINYKKSILITDKLQSEVPLYFFEILLPTTYILKTQFQINHFIAESEKIHQEEQDRVFLNLSSELNSEYELIKNELEQKLNENHKKLIESRQKILESNNRSETLRKILFSIHQETDSTRIETVLNELLPATTSVTWIKLIPLSLKNDFEKDLKSQLDSYFISYEIYDYIVYFIKGDKKAYKKQETELFLKICDGLRFNLNRAQQLKDLRVAEKILSTAFESFKQPLAVISANYEVIHANQVFYKNTATISNKCYNILFGRTEPCLNCNRGSHFNLQNNDQTFDVYSSQYVVDSRQANAWVHIYKDITEEAYLEQRILQTAKMKDLGLISSSIAHELNNPLGGILSYLQILKMDISAKSPLQGDLDEMIKTALKMKKTIEDLLIFSRAPQQSKIENVNLANVIDESFSIFDLIFKTEKIKVVHHQPEVPMEHLISKSLFKDSIYLMTQFFVERARLLKVHKPLFLGLIEVKYKQDQSHSIIEIQGNFGPLETNYKLKDVNFLMIHKSLLDQGFQVELTESNQTWVVFKLLLPKS